ncbi:glycerophosphodiester phosphodiesterase domain-containing protein 5 isoform X2 [Callorhinchus milii]|uniref:glycerophosphodiester phosphodiesterase domain-containing protein 5 isoform X2 n=1 Tax=Callorhinchus milii TaxID=7868 RepID=UPI001C3FB0CE|nr:glycerophosphodiester phosphodiesterase domain-containing protein 5 isoform X2 [Callorhinchus milii]
MGSSPGEQTNTKPGSWNVLQGRLLQRYENQPCLACLAGLYSCQWRRYQRAKTPPGAFCCSKVECSCLLVLVAAFWLSLVLLYFWSKAQNDYINFDWNFYSGKWIPWSMVVLVVVTAVFTYIALLLVLAICLLSESQRLYLHWCHKIGIFLVLIFSVVSIGVLFNQWAEEWTTFILSFQVTAPYLHIGGSVAMTLLSWTVSLHFARINKPGQLAPENTLMSFEKSIEMGTDGLETDVTISYDGIPFLMHDQTLQRTTNIREVLPNNSTHSADKFHWATLASLNAGKWFLKDDPFQSVHLLSKAGRGRAGNQSVCTLAELLGLAARHQQLVIFDLKKPHRSHPHTNTWVTTTIDVIKRSGIDHRLILWLPNELRTTVQYLAPGFVQVFGGKEKVEVLQMNNVTMVNLHYSQMSSEEIRIYAAANISTNLFTVSEPWLYSLVWCMGAHSVTTDAAHILKRIQRPAFLMTPRQYTAMWLSTDLVSCGLISLIFVFNWWRENGFLCCPHQQILRKNRNDGNLQTEFSVRPITGRIAPGEAQSNTITM